MYTFAPELSSSSRQPSQQQLSQSLGDGYIPLDNLEPLNADTFLGQPGHSRDTESASTPAESMLDSSLGGGEKDDEEIDASGPAELLMQAGAKEQPWYAAIGVYTSMDY